MTRQLIQAHIHQDLQPQFSADEIKAFEFWILPHCESLPEIDRLQALKLICEQLKQQIPIQYIFEAAFFGPLTLKVTPATLIPRPETEELCHLICERKQTLELSNGSNIEGLDIGTGSGCIPMYLLHQNPLWKFTGVDVSEDALDVAAENAFHVGIQDRLQLEHSNFLNWESLPPNIDLLVSNPPYIELKEAKDMADNVLKHEPHLALFTPKNDPLVFYRKMALLAETAMAQRTKPLHIWLEINQYLAEETKNLFASFAEAEVIRDMSDNPRFIQAIVLPNG